MKSRISDIILLFSPACRACFAAGYESVIRYREKVWGKKKFPSRFSIGWLETGGEWKVGWNRCYLMMVISLTKCPAPAYLSMMNSV